MSRASSREGEQRTAAERLLEDSWEARARRASQRELAVEATAGGLFVAAAGVLAAAGPLGVIHAHVAALLVLLYALVASVEFPVGTGHVVPTQLVLVPMLALLPPAVVPFAVLLGLLACTVADWVLGRVPARRIVSAVPDAWHALGPALVLLAAGSPAIDFTALPLVMGGFAACCLVDLASSLVRMRLAGIVPHLKVQARVMLTVWAVDACLAPLGFLVAITSERHLAAAGFALPLALLLWWLARDRSRRIAQAHARLKLLERERSRLQSAVHRLGDAFAAKLELDALLEIVVHATIEALDAAAARLDLSGLPGTRRFTVDPEGRLPALHAAAGGGAAPDAPLQTTDGRLHTLMLPIAISAEGRTATGTLAVAREGRAFQDDEIALVLQLLAKAAHAATEILANDALREQVMTDALTGLGNRRRLANDLARALEYATTDRPALLLLFDLDGFKAYNDAFGHLAGDALLTRLAAKLATAVDGRGGTYRLGGDEFCALIDIETDDVDEIVARTTAALSETGDEFTISASLGAVLLPHEAGNPDHALQLADERMYATKRGRAAGPRDQASDVLVRTMEAKQPELDAHAGEVATLAARVARRIGLPGEAIDEIARAAELHDIGKVGIPDEILNKPCALDGSERAFMRQHTILGERILNAAPALRPIARLVRASHERWDGTGYPDGLAGEEIPLGARIVAVCDAYEAMTADRPYRKAMPIHAARRELLANAGTQFDPAVVDAFLAATDPSAPAPPDDNPENAVDTTAARIRTVLHQPASSTLSAA